MCIIVNIYIYIYTENDDSPMEFVVALFSDLPYIVSRKRRLASVSSLSLILVGGIPTHLKNIKVCWDHYSQYGKMTMFQTTNQNLLMSSTILYVTCVTYHQNVELAWQIWEPRLCRPSHDEGGAFFNVGKKWQTHVTCLIIDGWGKSKQSKTVRSHFAYGYESKPWYPGDPK